MLGVPVTASNFIDLSKLGFFNGLHFHRVIADFMIQTGCPFSKDPYNKSAGTGGPCDGSFQNLQSGATERRRKGGNIEDEHCSQDSNAPGTLSMANSGQPNTGGSQFFINIADNSFLDWFSPGASKHTVFGRITSGFDVAVAISQRATKEDRPTKPVKLLSVKIMGDIDTEAFVRACHVGHAAAVRLLLIQGGPSTAATEDISGRSVLELAAKAGHSAVVRLLAEQLVADQETWKVQSATALVTASSHGRKEVVRELLEARAAVDARDSEGIHALAAAAAANHFATVSALLSARAAVNVCDSGGATAAVWAAGSGCSRVLLLLLGAGADVQVADEDGGTPLIWAAAGGHEASVAALLQGNADLNAADHAGRTALSWAAGQGHEAAMKALLVAGADGELRDCNGMSPQDWAVEEGCEDAFLRRALQPRS
eukprot:symbB.v1.2.029186.t1/scaffold3167.1/size62076/8